MKIETSEYQIADISANPQAIDAIQRAENEIAQATGTQVTLIAYSPSEEAAAEKPSAH